MKKKQHTYSLEIATFVQSGVPGPKPVNSLKDGLNTFDNYRMVSKDKNRKTNREIDRSLIAKYYTGETLTKKEENRARMQVEFAQNNPYIPEGHKKGMKEFYKSLKTQDGRTLWDSRKDSRS